VEKVVIVEMGVEGGGVEVYGRLTDGVWSFWREGSSMYLDENDDEAWASWISDPVTKLSLALPDEWSVMYPIKVHPDFVAQLRNEYVCCHAARTSGDPAGSRQHVRWQELLARSGQQRSELVVLGLATSRTSLQRNSSCHRLHKGTRRRLSEPGNISRLTGGRPFPPPAASGAAGAAAPSPR
jgi:hypothetical protein